MKPREAAGRLKELSDAVSKGEAARPSIRTWFSLAVYQRLNDPASSFDCLLGLRSRYAGRAWLGSTTHKRDAALRTYAATLGLEKVSHKAAEIDRLSRAGELSDIAKYGRIPGIRRLETILSET